MTSWPGPQDYNEAVQIADISFEDAQLGLCTPELNTMGLPRAYSGNFATVYKMVGQDKPLAVKCFLRNIYDRHQHYQALSQHLAVKQITSVIDFEYLLKGILVGDNWFPIVKLGWVEGLMLDQFMRKHLHNRQEIDRFLLQFVKVMKELQASHIAHGDLQHGNIIVRKSDVMLVDYDGMYVPSMGGQPGRELGHPNFQHPGRTADHFHERLDDFSAWIIYHTAQLLRVDPTLWQRNGGGEDCLLLRLEDFQHPEKSQLISELERHSVPEIRERSRLLRQLLELPYDKIPLFDPASEQSAIKSFAAPQPTPTVTYPSLEDYLQALHNHPSVLADQILQQSVQAGKPIIKKHGVTLKLINADKQYAVKCFLNHDPDRKRRYEAISKHDMGTAARHLVSFQYQAKGINLNGQWFPILRMTWFDGERIDSYVRRMLESSNKFQIHTIVENFREMMNAFAESGIAHGDLEPSNILVDTRGKIRLIDYDAMYVPELAGLNCPELGTPPFQHPSRKADHYGPYLDNYPAALIDGILSYMATLPPQTMWNWLTVLQDTKLSGAGLIRSADDHPRSRLNKIIKEMRKYRIDQIPSLKSNYLI